MLQSTNLRLGYDGPAIVDRLDWTVPPGQITALIGPNGCGKSTVLRALARLHHPRAGAVLLEGEDIHRRPPREVARRLGFLAQHAEVPEGVTLVDLVRRGRYPHRGPWAPLGPDDNAAVQRALETCSLTGWADRRVDELSGGQRQRAWIALTLAQDTPLILLDEPTTFLDEAHQAEVLDLILRLNREEGRTFVLVLHDLAQVRRIAHRVVAMKDGAILAEGTPDQILVPATLETLYGVPFDSSGPVPGVALGAPPCPEPGAPVVEARGLAAGYSGAVVFGPTDLTLGPGGLTVLLGPNGCGKSTLLRTLAGLHPALGGQALLDGRCLEDWRPPALAERRSFTRQDAPLPGGFTVAELLSLGGFPRRGLWGKTNGGEDAIQKALAALDLAGLETRSLEHLSGGQRQRVWLALALVQGSPLVLLDEPTSFLDPRHQRDLMDALWTLTREGPTTVVAILHERALAERYADRVVELLATKPRNHW